MWPQILEKGGAKARGNYLHLVGGLMTRGVNFLSGMHTIILNLKSKHLDHEFRNLNNLWLWMQERLEKTDILGVSAIEGNKMQKLHNFMGGHEYAVLQLIELPDKLRKKPTGKPLQLIKVRNPHGIDYYSGPYSDHSDLWTKELLEAAGHTIDPEDGIFYLEFKDAINSVDYVQANLNNKNMEFDYFLRLDDSVEKTEREFMPNRKLGK